MRCPKCQFDNPESAKFCGECGAGLEVCCPQCGKKNPPAGKFCFDCGHNLSLLSESPPIDLSFDEKIAKIQRYLPKGITEKILSQRDKIEGERKQVTVMFCDMKGFTPLSEKVGPESRKDRTQEALKRIVFKGSELRPLIMAIEDLHWIDRSSEDVLKELLGSISAARVFLVFTYRPEFVHTWGGRSYHSQITLNRLSNRESLELAAHVLGTKEMGKALEELILEKTEGVPFFIEEFIKSLKDLKVIEQKDDAYRLSKEMGQPTIPSTIQDVIMARVDSLPERAKEVLHAG